MPPLVQVQVAGPASATVFRTVLTQGPVSRVDVARRTGLSSAAVTKAARPFIEAGYLEELGSSPGTRAGAGRPPSPLAVRADREFFIGVKVTGTEAIGVLTDLGASVHSALHVPLSAPEAPAVVASVEELVNSLLAGGELRQRTHRLGVAVSGDVDRRLGLVRYSPSLDWHDVALADMLTAATGLSTYIENDVRALTVAEQWFGDGRGVSTFAVVTIGSGIGCGLVTDSVVVAGAQGVGGELGHVPVNSAGPLCRCGAGGCVEAIASTDAIETAARAATGNPTLTLEAAVDLARSGDEPVRAVFTRAAQAIGLGLAAVANLFGPERIIVSGEAIAAYDLYDEQIRRTFSSQAFGAAAQCDLLIRELPFEEWARGAAAVAIQTLFLPE